MKNSINNSRRESAFVLRTIRTVAERKIESVQSVLQYLIDRIDRREHYISLGFS